MNKKLVAILSAIVMLTAVFLFAGCDEANNTNTGNNENGENQNEAPLTIPTRLWVNRSELKEFNLDDEVTVELYFGTLWSKAEIDSMGISYVVDIVAECYQGKPQTGSIKEPPDAEALLLRVEEFYAENYPFSITEDLFYVAPSFNVALPKTLFVGAEGAIYIKTCHHGLWQADVIFYRIDGEKIILEDF